MTIVRIPRLDLHVRGLDAGVVRAALDTLPDALALALRAGAASPASAVAADVTTGGTAANAVRLAPGADARQVAAAVASQVAAAVRTQTGGGSRPGGTTGAGRVAGAAPGDVERGA